MGDRAGVWLRVSTRNQDEQSQVPDVMAWCESHGYEVVKPYQLKGRSAFKGEQAAVLAEDALPSFADLIGHPGDPLAALGQVRRDLGLPGAEVPVTSRPGPDVTGPGRAVRAAVGGGQVALSRFVLTATVTLTPDAAAAVTAGEPETGGAAGYGNVATVSPGTSGKYGWLPLTLRRGEVTVADSSAGSTGPQLLYQAIGAGNLRPYTQGTVDAGHAALAN